MTDDEQLLAITHVRELLSGLFAIVEQQQQVIKALLAKQRRLDERLDLELLHLQPAPTDDHDPHA